MYDTCKDNIHDGHSCLKNSITWTFYHQPGGHPSRAGRAWIRKLEESDEGWGDQPDLVELGAPGRVGSIRVQEVSRTKQGICGRKLRDNTRDTVFTLPLTLLGQALLPGPGSRPRLQLLQSSMLSEWEESHVHLRQIDSWSIFSVSLS